MHITPTPGRVVWYYPPTNDPLQSFSSVQAGKPLAAHIAHVWSDTCVNLMVIDPNGVPTGRTSVLLYQGDTDRPSSSFAEWMPYQKGQAAAAAGVGTAGPQTGGPDLASDKPLAATSPTGNGDTCDSCQ